MGEETIKLALLADGDAVVRRALRALLTQGLEVGVVGEAATAAELQRQVRELQPDLVVVAWNLVSPEAAAALAAIRAASPGSRLVALALRPETRRAALAAGADDFICKVDPPEQVLRVLQAGGGSAPAAGQTGQARDHDGVDGRIDREGAQR